MDQTWIYLKEEKNNVCVEHGSLMRWGEGAGASIVLYNALLVEGHS